MTSTMHIIPSGAPMGAGRRTQPVSRPRSRAALLPALWLAVFFAFPFLLVLRLSLSDTALAIPPYSPQIDWAGGWEAIKAFFGALDGEMYQRLGEDRLYFDAYVSSLRFAATGTLLALLVGYPMAYGMAKCRPGTRSVLLMLVILPFWTSFLIRVYAWVGILKPQGLLNAFLGLVGIAPLDLLYTPAAVQVGLVYSYLPFMVLPLYAALERQDHTLLEAAADLGSAAVEGVSGRSPGRSRSRGSSPAACCVSSPWSASSSFPTCWAVRAR